MINLDKDLCMQTERLIILGIESSCDETSAAVYDTQLGLRSNELYSQVDLHAWHGGVIPELSSRLHMEKISVIVKKSLDEAKLTLADIDVIAVTSKPGLPGALMIGVSYAKGLAFAGDKKLIGINHLEGHVFSACIQNNIPFPFICLTVSGGHTSMYYVTGFGQFALIGHTIDDAAGEAFDKIAKMMNLPYPGGPVIEKLAEQVNFQDFFHYTRGSMLGTNFSFSGLKTSVLYDLVKRGAYDLQAKKFLKDDDLEFKQQVASSLLVCVGDIFEKKLTEALKLYPEIKAISFVGGVACNKYLRRKLQIFADRRNIQLFYPSPKLCTDNAGMIAFVGSYKAAQNQFDGLDLSIF
ncbi:tRNA (adenosine(37)-N6)-threonylcarbamoyltransferase complex transferase subunit TsaD [Candidatus Babeliales bacterium]|nr:tRNA (adenosine(37)-N6)-threonylcarbamoyltransferase complex transferase subunit TsaD [Candidatus Babeliales bacterium]MBP9843416.1 tRNA (adenosine(37)-N6)-threonylcarbamoyltransferase complex transferase subunit TsaD [Candidatus Babeliales bacterium]